MIAFSEHSAAFLGIIAACDIAKLLHTSELRPTTTVSTTHLHKYMLRHLLQSEFQKAGYIPRPKKWE